MRVKDGTQVRAFRKKADLTQDQLGFLANCSQATISLIEKGLLENISVDLAETLARRLDVPAEFLFEKRGNERVRRVAHDALALRQRARDSGRARRAQKAPS